MNLPPPSVAGDVTASDMTLDHLERELEIKKGRRQRAWEEYVGADERCRDLHREILRRRGWKN